MACVDLVEDGLEETDSLHKAVALDGHDDVDGIEVLLATKTAGQVGLGMAGG